MVTELSYSDFDDDAVQTMRLANEYAMKLDHDFIDTEHILMGLIRNIRSDAVGTIVHFGVQPGTVIAELKRRVKRGQAKASPGKRDVRPNAKRITEHATNIAGSMDSVAVGTNHILLGALFVDGGVASDVLNTVGVNYNGVLAFIAKT